MGDVRNRLPLGTATSLIAHLWGPLAYQALLVGIGVPTGIIAARFLGPEQRGVLAVFIASSFMLSTVVCVCSHESLPFLIRTRNPPARVVGSIVALQVLLGSVAAGLSLILPFLPFTPSAAATALSHFQPFFAAACIGYATNHAISTGVLALVGATSFLRAETARNVAYLVFLVVFVIGQRQALPGALTAYVLALAVQVTVAAGTLRGATRGWQWDRVLAAKELHFGVRALPARIADYLFARGGDVLVMSLAITPVGVGYYVVARSLVDLTLLPAVSASLVIQGASAPSKKSTPRTKHLMFGTAGLTLTGVAMLALAGTPLLVFVFGESFAPAGILLRWLLTAVPALLFVRIITAWNTREGFPLRNSIGTACGAVMLVVMVPPAGRFFGAAGAVATFSLVIWFQCLILAVLHRRGTAKQQTLGRRGRASDPALKVR